MVVYFGGAQIFQKSRKYLKIQGAWSVTFQEKALRKIDQKNLVVLTNYYSIIKFAVSPHLKYVS